MRRNDDHNEVVNNRCAGKDVILCDNVSEEIPIFCMELGVFFIVNRPAPPCAFWQRYILLNYTRDGIHNLVFVNYVRSDTVKAYYSSKSCCTASASEFCSIQKELVFMWFCFDKWLWSIQIQTCIITFEIGLLIYDLML